eukprot:g4158.t1
MRHFQIIGGDGEGNDKGAAEEQGHGRPRRGEIMGKVSTPLFLSPTIGGYMPFASPEETGRKQSEMPLAICAAALAGSSTRRKLEEWSKGLEQERKDEQKAESAGLSARFKQQVQSTAFTLVTSRSMQPTAPRPSAATGIPYLTADGSITLTPRMYAELALQAKAHAVVSFSDEIPCHMGAKRQRKSVERSLAWLDEMLAARTSSTSDMMTLAVCLGGKSSRLRKGMASDIAKRDGVDGVVIGGITMGETMEEREEIFRAVIENLPQRLPRFVEGSLDPVGIMQAIAAGVDVVSSSYPFDLTSEGCACTCPLSWSTAECPPREPGGAYKLCLRDARFEFDERPLMRGCECYACRQYSRAYIHHLVNCDEMLGLILLYEHNTKWMRDFFQSMRESMARSAFVQFQHLIVKRMGCNIN